MQLLLSLGVTYMTAWLMAHRIREAMSDPAPQSIGGPNRVVEADETYVGGKEAQQARREAHAWPPRREGQAGGSCRLSSARGRNPVCSRRIGHCPPAPAGFECGRVARVVPDD